MFEQCVLRFHRGISQSELYQMRDVIEVTERDRVGKMVVLSAAINVPSLNSTTSEEVNAMLFYF